MAMERCDLQCGQASGKSLLQHLSLFLRALGDKFQRWGQLAEQRRQLREMDDHLLKDIGLSRADVERIAGHRWFWDDPLLKSERVDQRHRSSDSSGKG